MCGYRLLIRGPRGEREVDDGYSEQHPEAPHVDNLPTLLGDYCPKFATCPDSHVFAEEPVSNETDSPNQHEPTPKVVKRKTRPEKSHCLDFIIPIAVLKGLPESCKPNPKIRGAASNSDST